jgi:hypothetical protein
MRARRVSRNTTCVSNLRQIGQMLIMYAEANNDYITLGISGLAEDGAALNDSDVTYELGTCYPIILGHTSGGLGPLFANGMLSTENGKMLYCPIDPDERLTYNRFRERFPGRKVQPAPGTTIRISYFCRPVNRYFRHTLAAPPKPAVFWPTLLTRLTDMQGKALVSERVGAPYAHGSDSAPLLNVVYFDGAVQSIPMPSGQSIGAGLLVDELPPPGFVAANDPSPTRSPGSDHVLGYGWDTLDGQYGK